MLTETMTGGVEALLAEMRSRRKLPHADERRACRIQAGLKQREVADAIGVSVMAVHRWEQGAQPRRPEHFAAYVRLLEELRRIGEASE